MVNGVEIAGVIGGSGPPLLLLHGHPQSHVIWHKVAHELAHDYTVVATDLRGYGASSQPVGDSDHANYSKRAMAQDVVALLDQLGDSLGGRAAVRLAQGSVRVSVGGRGASCTMSVKPARVSRTWLRACHSSPR